MSELVENRKAVVVDEYDIPNIFRYHNDFNVVIPAKLNAKEWDFFFLVCTALCNKETKEVHIPIQVMRKLAQYKSRSIAQNRKILDSMLKKTLSARVEVEGVLGAFNIFSYLYFNESENAVVARVAPGYTYYFNWLNSNFTVINLNEFVGLKSKYSKLLYRQLRQYRRSGFWSVDIKKLRLLLDVPEDYSTGNLMQRVLVPAIEELQELFPDLQVKRKTEAVNGGEKIVGFLFTFKPEEPRTYNSKKNEELSRMYLDQIYAADVDDEEYIEPLETRRLQELGAPKGVRKWKDEKPRFGVAF